MKLKERFFLPIKTQNKESVGFGSDGSGEDANHRWSGVHQSNHYSQILLTIF